MRKFHLIALVIATLSGAALTALTTPASACPGGYVRCGGACCPGR